MLSQFAVTLRQASNSGTDWYEAGANDGAPAEREQRVLKPRDLPPPGGGGTSGGVTDDWKASVDRQLEQLHGDVRNLLYGLIGGFLLLASMIGGLYVRTDAKFEALHEELATMRTDQAKGYAELNGKLELLVERSKPSH